MPYLCSEAGVSLMFVVQRYVRGSHKPDRTFHTKAAAMDRLASIEGRIVDSEGEVLASNYAYKR
jgi:hypothetical protein